MKKLFIAFAFVFALIQTGICQPKEITILFAYTTQAACAVGGPKEIRNRVDGGMKLLNDALSNSGVGCKVTAIPEYVEVTYGSAKNKDEVKALFTLPGLPSAPVSFYPTLLPPIDQWVEAKKSFGFGTQPTNLFVGHHRS